MLWKSGSGKRTEKRKRQARRGFLHFRFLDGKEPCVWKNSLCLSFPLLKTSDLWKVNFRHHSTNPLPRPICFDGFSLIGRKFSTIHRWKRGKTFTVEKPAGKSREDGPARPSFAACKGSFCPKRQGSARTAERLGFACTPFDLSAETKNGPAGRISPCRAAVAFLGYSASALKALNAAIAFCDRVTFASSVAVLM